MREFDAIALGRDPGHLVRVAQGRTVLCVTHRLYHAVDSDRVIVLSHGALAEQGTRNIIVQEGDPGDRLYIICRGSANVTQRTPTGQRQLAVLESGDFFGEIALLESSPRTATVRARTPCTLISLRREHFMGLLESAPHLKEILVKVAEERKRTTEAARREVG